MALYYSGATLGFYDTKIIGIVLPDDAVAISEAEYYAAMLAQEQGRLIRPDVNGRPIAVDYVPSETELLDSCKLLAKQALTETDWVELPSVSDVSRTPHLVNVEEFLKYRSALRRLAVAPITSAEIPQRPVAVWSE